MVNFTVSKSPHWLLRGGHAQTLGAYFLFQKQASHFIDDHVKTRDGDTLLCRRHWPSSFTDNTQDANQVRKVALLFHGLSGSSESNYMIYTADELTQQGWAVVRVNQRSAGASLRLSQGLYHSHRLDDFEDVFLAYKNIFPKAEEIVFIGYSMSGGMVLRYGASHRQQPQRLVSVCAPLELKEASLAMNRGMNRVYQANFMNELVQIVKTKKGSEFVQKNKLHMFTSVYEFDQALTTFEAGFENVEEYYRECSAFDKIPEIKTPHIVIAAKDDPIVDFRFYEKAQWNSLSRVYMNQYGGHMGFVTQGESLLSHERALEKFISMALLR